MKKAKITQAKSQAKNETIENTAPELQKLAYIFGSLVVIFLLFYAITYFKLKLDNEKDKKVDVSQTIQFDEILTGNLLKQNNDEYYVLVYDKEEEFTNMYRAFINIYIKKEDALRVYYSDLNNTFNAQFKNENSNLKITNIGDLKIKTTTLFKIKDGKIINVYEGEESVINAFKQIIK